MNFSFNERFLATDIFSASAHPSLVKGQTNKLVIGCDFLISSFASLLSSKLPKQEIY
jgi:hypothetical protein